MMTLPVCSVVTQKTIGEFEVLRTSLEYYHNCSWVICCDDVVYEKYKNVKNIECLKLISSDECDHNTGDENKKNIWMDVMMTKFDGIQHLISNFGHGLFLDSDMIFVNEFEEKILSLFENKNIDAVICQHMTNNWPVEAKHGLYNAGMFHLKNKQFLDEWKNLSKNYKKFNFYFEQQPLEYVQRNFISLNLPINYNIGWWRFNSEQTKQRIQQLHLQDDKIMFGKLPAVNFHVHTLKENGYENFGQFLVDKISALFKSSNNVNYLNVLKRIESNND